MSNNNNICQYANLYYSRLCTLRPKIVNNYKNNTSIRDCCNHSVSDSEEEFLIGTVLSSNSYIQTIDVLNETCSQLLLTNDQIKERLLNTLDLIRTDRGKFSFCLEDETGRIVLKFDCADIVIPGSVIGVIGHLGNDGIFNVKRIIYPEPIPPAKCIENKVYIYISDLNLLSSSSDDIYYRKLIGLRRWIKAESERNPLIEIYIMGTLTNTSREFSQSKSIFVIDEYLSKISGNIHIIPSQNDISLTNFAYPQRPVHSQFFQKTQSVSSRSNPNISSDMIITSGEGICDARQRNTDKNQVDIMKTMLKLRHICPTAPDSLPCEPQFDTDPFVIDLISPKRFISSNVTLSENMEYETFEGVDILVVPNFHKTSQFVICRNGVYESVCIDT